MVMVKKTAALWCLFCGGALLLTGCPQNNDKVQNTYVPSAPQPNNPQTKPVGFSNSTSATPMDPNNRGTNFQPLTPDPDIGNNNNGRFSPTGSNPKPMGPITPTTGGYNPNPVAPITPTTGGYNPSPLAPIPSTSGGAPAPLWPPSGGYNPSPMPPLVPPPS